MADLKNTDDLMNSPTGLGFGVGLPLEKQNLLCPTSSRLLTHFFLMPLQNQVPKMFYQIYFYRNINSDHGWKEKI